MEHISWTWSTLVFLYLLQSTQESFNGRHSNKQFRPHHNDHRHWGPFFEEASANASSLPAFSSGGTYALAVPAGGPLHLNCRVALLQDKVVMWVKKTAERVSLLTVGAQLYSADSRYRLRFLYPNNWRLEISPVMEGDDGLYMCQVSTHPPKVLATNLTVLSPEVMVVDEHGEAVTERYYREGSRVELMCRARVGAITDPVVQNNSTELPLWYKDGVVTNLQMKPTIHSSDEVTDTVNVVSRIVIPVADRTDSGAYSCRLSNRTQASVSVHVLQGETQAAVHHEASSSKFCQDIFSILALLLFLCIL